MPDNEVAKSLVARLAEACNAVGGVEKKGTNESQRYKYVKAADVAKAFRHELFERGIVIIPDEKELTQTGVVTTKSGAELREFTLKMEYHICDAYSPEKITVGAIGVAMDSGDKAIWKAKTGALKYFLRTIGIMPDEKDDPEADEEVDKLIAGPPQVAPKLLDKIDSQVRISQFQINAIKEACERTKKSAIEQSEYLGKLKLVQWEELTKQDFQDALKFCNSTVKVPAKAPGKPQDHTLEMKRIFATASERGVPEVDVKRWSYETFGVESMTVLDKGQLDRVLEFVKQA